MPAPTGTATKRATAAKKSATSKKPPLTTRTELCNRLGDATGLTRKQVDRVFEEYRNLAEKELGKKGSGIILLPYIARLKAKHVPATRDRTKPNPFKPGETMTVKAKPARIRIRISALKWFAESLS